jgi:hypothetical protein
MKAGNVRFSQVAALILAMAAGEVTQAAENPQAVLPSGAAGMVRVGDVCPTFSWMAVPSADQYELVVYAVSGGKAESTELLRQGIPGGATSWTLSADRCLDRGGQYAWSVRAEGENGVTEWSAPSLFEVQTAERYAADAGSQASAVPAVAPVPLAPGDEALNVNGSAVITVGSTGTILLFGRVLGEAGTVAWDTGAYTTTGDPLPPITDNGTGEYLIGLPGGETFRHGNHGVVVTPIEYDNARIVRIEQGVGGTIEVNISDARDKNVDEDFQIIVFND